MLALIRRALFVIIPVISAPPEVVWLTQVVCKKNKGYDKNNEEKDEGFYDD